MLNILKSQPIIPVLFQDNTISWQYRIPGLSLLKSKTDNVNLFFGGQYNSRGLKTLKNLGITAIVNVRSQMVKLDAAHKEFKYFHLPSHDNNPPSLEMLITGTNFIDKELKSGGKVYINCLRGLGRGPALTIAYLIKTGSTFDEAHALIKKLRPDIDLSVLQISRLKELQSYYSKEKDYV